MKWISVDLYLPAHREAVLTWDGRRIRLSKRLSSLKKNQEFKSLEDGASYRYGVKGENGQQSITHWMPLPDKPTEDIEP